MKPCVIHHRDQRLFPDAVYIGRPSKWGNPFIVGRDGTRKEVIAKYRDYLHANPALLADARKELKGKTLVCWCKPKDCHGDVLIIVANYRTLFD